MEERLTGRVALITGASRGIGKATALCFASHGASVVVNYAKSREAAHEVVDEIAKAGGKAIALQADVARAREVQAMVDEALGQLGKIDILVNNAGLFRVGQIRALSDADLEEMIAINVKGVIHCARAVTSHMISQRYGKIINVSSIAAFGTTVAGTTPYAATKAAVVALTKRLALELGPHGINVNAICPGFIRTDMSLPAAPSEAVQARVARLAGKAMLRRVGEPEDIARSALFLASDDSSFVTAQVLTVDGGRMDFLSHSG